MVHSSFRTRTRSNFNSHATTLHKIPVERADVQMFRMISCLPYSIPLLAEYWGTDGPAGCPPGTPAPAMSPQLLDLSTELVIHILSYLSVHDVGACTQASRRLRSIVSGSQYLQYLVRTQIAGVQDPFLPGLSIHERIAALERWQRAWHGLDLRQPALQCIVPRDITVGAIGYEIHGGYLIATRRFPVDDRPMGYSYIDLHDAVQRGCASWNNVDLPQSQFVFAYCFDVEEYNLAVILVFNPGDDPEPHGSLRLMDFRKGTNHPLAAVPTVQLQSEGKRMNVYDTYDVHMETAGDHVIVMITQARILPDFIYVVGWKTGNVSLVLTAPDLTYASSFALIDAELLVLVNLQTDTLDIHRLVGGKKLLRVRQLCLPIPRAGAHPLSTSFRLSQACLTTSPSSRSRSRCLPFRPSPDACLVGLSAQMATQNGAMTSYWLTMRRDYLSSDLSSGCGPTSWETWSTRMACCVEMERPLIAPIPAGSRWLVYSQPLVVREFGGRLRADRRTHPGEDARGAGVREALQDVLASQLPCCDIISVGESKYQSISADYEWVVGMNEESDEFSRRIHRIDIHHII
ncbi:hypothetical protein EDB84DRAFT_1536677 [Lactarius hengduanensis]|nr:hypothetical protein EDB84DRAFT_1536677 [Lactarius hengduanensis]